MSTLDDRSAARRGQMVANLAHSHDEAEAWDLEFWQKAGSDARLSALVAMHEDVGLVIEARIAAEAPGGCTGVENGQGTPSVIGLRYRASGTGTGTGTGRD